MINAVQKQKITHLFNILDANKNGVLQPNDFTIVANRISNLLGYGQDSTARLALEVRSFRIFIQLLYDLENEQAMITHAEWINLFDHMLKDEQQMKSYIERIAAYIFMLFDQDNDQVVSEEEFTDMFKVYNIPEEYVRIAFMKLDENGDGVLQREEIIDAFTEFFLSEEPTATGNWIFGHWEVEVTV